MLDTLLIDGHNDVPFQFLRRVQNRVEDLDFEDTSALDPPMHTDLRRLRAGGVGAQFWAAYVPIEAAGPGASRVMFEQIDVAHRLTARYPATLELALDADDVERIHASGRIASLIAVEGGHALENSTALLRAAWHCGARYLTLTHNIHTDWADSATQDPVHGGLTSLGRSIVTEMNRIGMLVDLSHTSPETMRDALETSTAPVVFTHSGARSVTDHVRNVPDDVLETVRDRGGLVMATFVPDFVSERVRRYRAEYEGEIQRLAFLERADPDARAREIEAWEKAHPMPEVTLADVADHIDHLVSVMGAEHVGIGSDFDGITKVPVGLEDASCFPALLAELARRGHDAGDIRRIAGANLLRVMRAAAAVTDSTI